MIDAGRRVQELIGTLRQAGKRRRGRNPSQCCLEEA
jgi:hypothetical protein